MSLIQLTDDSFKKDVLDSELPVLVDFWAPWCGPCKMLGPILEEFAKEFDKQLKIAKINIDESPKTATLYGVMSIPTLMFFKKGKVISQLVGVLNKSELKRKIQENL